MSVLTLLMCLFTVVLYLFLAVVRKDIQIVAASRKGGKAAIAFFSLVVIIAMFFMEETFENRLRGVVSGLLFLSFVFDSRGLAEDRFIIHPLNLVSGSGSGGTVSGEQGPMDQNEFLPKRDARTTVEIRASNGRIGSVFDGASK